MTNDDDVCVHYFCNGTRILMALLSSGNDCIAIGMNLLSQTTHPKTCCFVLRSIQWEEVGSWENRILLLPLFLCSCCLDLLMMTTTDDDE
jgi:hypothetical protein